MASSKDVSEPNFSEGYVLASSNQQQSEQEAQNVFGSLQVSPEKITHLAVGNNDVHYYKVDWQETWLTEDQLVEHSSLIEEYQHRLTAESIPTMISLIPTPRTTSPTTTANRVSNFISVQSNTLYENFRYSGKAPAHFTAVSCKPSTNRSSLIPPPNDYKISTGIKLIGTKIAINGERSEQHSPLEEKPAIVNGQIVLGQKALNLAHEQNDSNLTSSGGGEQVQMEIETVEGVTLKLVSTPNSVRRNRMTIQLDDFELVNIENKQASYEDLAAYAHETLASFKRKRVRFPNGSSRLPQFCFFCTKTIANRKKLREHQFGVHFKNVGEYVCGICQKRFIFRRHLKAHMTVHTDNRNFHCTICGLTCKRRSHLHKHMATHTKEKNFRCDVCHQTFKVQANLKAHCMAQHKTGQWKCTVCQQTLHTSFSVYIHSMRHSGTRDYTCEKCDASFKRKQHLLAHMNVHEEFKDHIKCPICKKEFPDRKAVRKHLIQLHPEHAEQYRYDYICAICDKDFAYKGRLDEHVKIHEEETADERLERELESTKKVSKLSLEGLSRFTELFEKVFDEEGQLAMLRCKLCPRREFRKVIPLEKHYQQHRSGKILPPPKFECESCKESFSSKIKFQRHQVMHEKVVPPKTEKLRCQHCSRVFAWKSCLDYHLNRCENKSRISLKRKVAIKKLLNKELLDDKTEEKKAVMEKRAFSNSVTKVIRLKAPQESNEATSTTVNEAPNKNIEVEKKNISNEIVVSKSSEITVVSHEKSYKKTPVENNEHIATTHNGKNEPSNENHEQREIEKEKELL